MYSGSCLCGSVAFTIDGDLSPPSVCHCGQCRKQSGHVWASTTTHQDNLSFSARDTLNWFHASDTARRGFCTTCGSQMFWTEETSDNISVMAGSIDGDSGLSMDRQLYPDDKGDYYALPEVAVVDQSTLK